MFWLFPFPKEELPLDMTVSQWLIRRNFKELIISPFGNRDYLSVPLCFRQPFDQVIDPDLWTGQPAASGE